MCKPLRKNRNERKTCVIMGKKFIPKLCRWVLFGPDSALVIRQNLRNSEGRGVSGGTPPAKTSIESEIRESSWGSGVSRTSTDSRLRRGSVDGGSGVSPGSPRSDRRSLCYKLFCGMNATLWKTFPCATEKLATDSLEPLEKF